MDFDNNDIDTLKEFKHVNINKLVCSKNAYHIDLKKRVILETQFLDDAFPNTPFKLRMHHIIYNANEVPKCSIDDCNNLVGYKKDYIDIDSPYNIFCSQSCRGKNRRLYHDRDWLYKQHIELKKSAERIAKENETSSVPVVNALARFNIPHLNYTKSSNSTQRKLEDRDWLYEKHKIERLKCQEIADLIGSSKSTVSVWLDRHGIESNACNAYDRAFNKTSSYESEIVDYIKSIYSGEILLSNRSILSDGKELDVVIPEYNLAIEFNGDYYHAINGPNNIDKHYHKHKTDMCEAVGYNLIHIYEYIWKSKSEIYKSIISGKLNANRRVFARSCEIIDLDKYDAYDFLNENHLQGRNNNDRVFLGLKYGDEIVSVMTFTKPRFNRSVDWELSRFCTKKYTSVIGGASRLLKRFRSTFDGSIVSYADRSYSTGGLYRKLGFTNTHINEPNYVYIKGEKVYTRFQTQKKYLNKILDEYDETLSERVNMINNGYYVIYNSGTLTYILE